MEISHFRKIRCFRSKTVFRHRPAFWEHGKHFWLTDFLCFRKCLFSETFASLVHLLKPLILDPLCLRGWHRAFSETVFCSIVVACSSIRIIGAGLSAYTPTESCQTETPTLHKYCQKDNPPLEVRFVVSLASTHILAESASNLLIYICKKCG